MVETTQPSEKTKLLEQFELLKNNRIPGVEIHLVNDAPLKLNVILDGPQRTPYKVKKYTVNFEFVDYP